jgi:hypothetical protein
MDITPNLTETLHIANHLELHKIAIQGIGCLGRSAVRLVAVGKSSANAMSRQINMGASYAR